MGNVLYLFYCNSREKVEEAFRAELPNYAQDDFTAALRDEPEAGLSLCCSAPPSLRGELAVFFFVRLRHTQAFRDVFAHAWEMNHREVIEAVGTRCDLEAMFQAASFPIPDEWSDRVTIYRGTSFLPFEKSKRGFSWTMDKRVAAFFAMRFALLNGNPLVLKATVPKSSILFYSDGRSEREAICFHVRGAQVDGTPDEWEKLFDDFSAQRKAELHVMLDEAKAKREQATLIPP